MLIDWFGLILVFITFTILWMVFAPPARKLGQSPVKWFLIGTFVFYFYFTLAAVGGPLLCLWLRGRLPDMGIILLLFVTGIVSGALLAVRCRKDLIKKHTVT